ncbi:MAG: lipoprotein [Beijerinckiaceae bacterium]
MKRRSIRPGTRRALAFGLTLALAFAAGGCGRKGPLEPHPAEQRAAAPDANKDRKAQKFSIGSSRKTLSSPITPPDRPFILDSLL